MPLLFLLKKCSELHVLSDHCPEPTRDAAERPAVRWTFSETGIPIFHMISTSPPASPRGPHSLPEIYSET